MASAVKVTPKQCPDLHAKLQIACTTLGVAMPDMFIQQNPLVNAFTGGVEKPIIVLHSALIERLNEEETLAVIAHEVGHIHAEHVLYLTAARLFEALANFGAARLILGRHSQRRPFTSISDLACFGDHQMGRGPRVRRSDEDQIANAGRSNYLFRWERRITRRAACRKQACCVCTDRSADYVSLFLER